MWVHYEYVLVDVVSTCLLNFNFPNVTIFFFVCPWLIGISIPTQSLDHRAMLSSCGQAVVKTIELPAFLPRGCDNQEIEDKLSWFTYTHNVWTKREHIEGTHGNMTVVNNFLFPKPSAFKLILHQSNVLS